MRIAQIAPLYEAVPPRLYGGTERVVPVQIDTLSPNRCILAKDYRFLHDAAPLKNFYRTYCLQVKTIL